MKNKTIKARRMFANYYPHCPVPEIFDSKSRAMSWKKSYPATVTVPVAVIPLDDVESLKSAAYAAYCSKLDSSMGRVCAALTAIGVLPRTRKGGAK